MYNKMMLEKYSQKDGENGGIHICLIVGAIEIGQYEFFAIAEELYQ